MPIYVNLTHPANQKILAYLGVKEPVTTYTVDEIHALKLGWSLGTHPDLVDYFWGLGATLPQDCTCVINQRSYPLLVNPTTGIIFGVAGGTDIVAFRLPEPERTAALAVPGYGAEYHYPDAVIYAKTIGGDDWVLVKLFESVNAEWCRKAYDYSEIAIQPSA